MTTERFVVIGVATARADWFRATSQWASSAALPIEFIRCVSVDEAKARLASGRQHSAVVVDESIQGLDRNLVGSCSDAGCAVVVVADKTSEQRWADLGVDDVITVADFDRTVLLDVLRRATKPVTNVVPENAEQLRHNADSPKVRTWSGELVAVVGAGGTGTSTVAMALAQGLGNDPRRPGVVLADFQLDADLAMLHDAQDVVPGLQELLDSHRQGVPSRTSVHQGCFSVEDRSYDLLLGLRQHRDWTVLRRRTTQATVTSLLRSYRYVVADVGCDLEGANETGSHDVEERNLLARITIGEASVVALVGDASMHGLFAMNRIRRRLLDFGVPADRLLPVLNNAPRRTARRKELITGFLELVDQENSLRAMTTTHNDDTSSRANTANAPTPSPIFVPHRRSIEQGARSAEPLPQALVKPITASVAARLAAAAPKPEPVDEPEPVVAGSLGSLTL